VATLLRRGAECAPEGGHARLGHSLAVWWLWTVQRAWCVLWRSWARDLVLAAGYSGRLRCSVCVTGVPPRTQSDARFDLCTHQVWWPRNGWPTCLCPDHTSVNSAWSQRSPACGAVVQPAARGTGRPDTPARARSVAAVAHRPQQLPPPHPQHPSGDASAAAGAVLWQRTRTLQPAALSLFEHGDVSGGDAVCARQIVWQLLNHVALRACVEGARACACAVAGGARCGRASRSQASRILRRIGC
jgi:hypothetical protein